MDGLLATIGGFIVDASLLAPILQIIALLIVESFVDNWGSFIGDEG